MRAVFVLLITLLTAACPAASPNPAPLGINLTELTYYSAELPFIDVMKHAAPWSSGRRDQPWVDAGPLKVSASGDVLSLASGAGQMAKSLTLRTPHFPPGRYVLTWEGEGTVRCRFACKEIEREPGRIVLQVWSSEEGIEIDLNWTNPENPARNFKLIHEDHLPLAAAGKVFRPEFLERWRGFKVIRFMDWQRVNDTQRPPPEWATRTTPDHFTQARTEGVSLEHMIDLCNELEADAWFCIPHNAGDEYIRHFATLVRDRLAAGRKVYVEYSNEIWNQGFGQGTYCEKLGLSMRLASEPYPARLRYQALRSVEIFKIFHEVFGKQKERVVRVLAAQAANLYTATQMLDFRDTARHVDALAIAPYFGHEMGTPAVLKMTDAQLMDQLEKKMRTETFTWIDQYVKQMRSRNRGRAIPLIAYEGGQHVVAHGEHADNEAITAKLTGLNRHPRMHDLYAAFLRKWSASDGGIMVLFNSMGRYTKWGSWGLLEHEGQPPDDAPKYRAAKEHLAR